MAPQYESVKVEKIWEEEWPNWLQMAKFECPRHWKLSVSFSFEVGKFPEQKGFKGMQMVQFECPRHWKTLCLIHFWGWVNSPFPLLALWGNKKWFPSMKVENLKKYGNKSGLMGCKWSSLNDPGTENPLSHSVLRLEEFPFSHYWPSGVIRNCSPVWKWKIVKFLKIKCDPQPPPGLIWIRQTLKFLFSIC